MRIALGQDVFAEDGVKVGTVDRVVLNDVSHRVEAIVVHKGVIFTTDKLIDRGLIDRAESDGVHLTIKASEERKLPDFYDGLNYAWVDDTFIGYPGLGPDWHGSSLLYTNPPMPGQGYPGVGGFFELIPTDPKRVRPGSKLTADEVWVGKGADVVSKDHHTLGHVHDILLDAAGGLSGVIVRSGLVRHHDLEIPAAWIAEVDDDHLRLTVTSAEAQRGSKVDHARGHIG